MYINYSTKTRFTADSSAAIHIVRPNFTLQLHIHL